VRKLIPNKVFVQYRGSMKPYSPLKNRSYTITHSDMTGELCVIVADDYAEDQISEMRDEVRISWRQHRLGFVLFGSVLVDGEGVTGNTSIRSDIFYNEMPIALQALRQADRFLFGEAEKLDNTPIYIHFISDNPAYNRIYYFGAIGSYQ
jgi:hypothetical protein